MTTFRMPAEWEKHRATWIAWPWEESDWPGKFSCIPWVYAEIVRILSSSEVVEVLCKNEIVKSSAEIILEKSCVTNPNITNQKINLHLVENDRSWLRDSGAIGVLDEKNALNWLNFQFNGWAKYENYKLDELVPSAFSRITNAPLVSVVKETKTLATNTLQIKALEKLVLEGGAIDVNGSGTLLTTEECLLSEVQQRNSGFSKTDYEKYFEKYLGIKKTIWLDKGILGDDTHGHVDDIARFVAEDTVLLAYEEDTSQKENYQICEENYQRLVKTKTALGNSLTVIKLPMPEPIAYEDYFLPASYANFYIGNSVVIVPTFNDPQDSKALNIIQSVFPKRQVIGINCRDLILGLGTLHCLTQQEPSCEVR